MNKKITDKEPTKEPLPWDVPRFSNWIAVAKVYQQVRRSLAEGLEVHGIDLPYYDILATSFRFPELTQTQLAEKLTVGRSNLSMLLPEMERKGWIKRELDQKDKRIKRIRLTAKGKKLALKGLAVQADLITHMLGSLSEHECDQIGKMMRQVGSFMDEHPYKPKR